LFDKREEEEEAEEAREEEEAEEGQEEGLDCCWSKERGETVSEMGKRGCMAKLEAKERLSEEMLSLMLVLVFLMARGSSGTKEEANVVVVVVKEEEEAEEEETNIRFCSSWMWYKSGIRID
jgi:hypothetical protein